LRKTEAELAAALQTQRIALQRLEDDYQRHRQDLEDAQAQLTQAMTDEAHEQQSLKEASETLARIEEEHTKIVADQGDEDGQLAQKQTLRDELEQKVVTLEEKYTA